MSHQPKLTGLVLPPVEDVAPDSCDLRDWPHVSAKTVCHHAKQLGAAGEALVDYQMLCVGELSLAVGEFFPYDRLIVRPDGLIRLQVKTVIMPADKGYTVEPRKGYRGSPRGLQRYAAGDFDLLAIAILREAVVYYTAEHAPTYHIPLSAIAGLRSNPRASFARALADVEAATEARGPAPRLVATYPD